MRTFARRKVAAGLRARFSMGHAAACASLILSFSFSLLPVPPPVPPANPRLEYLLDPCAVHPLPVPQAARPPTLAGPPVHVVRRLCQRLGRQPSVLLLSPCPLPIAEPRLMRTSGDGSIRPDVQRPPSRQRGHLYGTARRRVPDGQVLLVHLAQRLGPALWLDLYRCVLMSGEAEKARRDRVHFPCPLPLSFTSPCSKDRGAD